MRCALASLGRRGDVEPFIRLAQALTARNHAVTIALHDGYRALEHMVADRIC